MKNIILLFCIIASSVLLAQEASVAFKTKTASYNFNKNIKIKMNCEMADIIINKSNIDKVDIKCTYSARHSDKNVAAKELERHQVLISKTINDIYISNYFTILKGEQDPKAKLRIKIEITVPDDIKIDIKNNFGSCSINELSIKGNIEQSFGKVNFQKLKAELKLRCELSDIKLINYTGSMELHNQSGDVEIKNMDGNLLLIENSNASIDIDGIGNNVNTKLVLNNCKLNVKGIDYQKHAINIDSYKESINHSQNWKVEKKGENYKVVSNIAKPQFIIKSLYTKINLF